MHKLSILLLLLSSPVWAAWKSISEDDAGITYVDPAAIVRSGDTAKLWSVLDYKNFQRMVEVGYFSQKVQLEFDCAQRKFRGLSVALHADHMGEGKVVYTDESPHDWEPVSSGSPSQTLWDIACR